MPISTEFTIVTENMVSSLPSGKTVVLPPKSSRIEIARIKKIDPYKSNKFSYQMMTNFGNVLLTDFDEDYVYDLPFPKGKTYKIYQGYHGKSTHKDADALDFSLQTGDQVMAAREGLVVYTVENNDRGCPSRSCAQFANTILIMHSDGSFAEYTHLRLNGAQVEVGQQVKKGQLIGFSGNTGYSSGPHLHFSVFHNRIDGKRSYIRTKFRTSTSPAELLKEHGFYTRNY